MAYSDYGAFVYKNGVRRPDKEDVGIFDTEEAKHPSGMRVWANLIRLGVREGRDVRPWEYVQHGVMGDGKVRLVCRKQGFPTVCVWDDGAEEPRQIPEKDIIEQNGWTDESWVSRYGGSAYVDYDYPGLEFTVDGLDGYAFSAESGKPYRAEMTEPDGTRWTCEYDYMYGAGFEED